jgi:hypothetical protein
MCIYTMYYSLHTEYTVQYMYRRYKLYTHLIILTVLYKIKKVKSRIMHHSNYVLVHRYY